MVVSNDVKQLHWTAVDMIRSLRKAIIIYFITGLSTKALRSFIGIYINIPKTKYGLKEARKLWEKVQRFTMTISTKFRYLSSIYRVYYLIFQHKNKRFKTFSDFWKIPVYTELVKNMKPPRYVFQYNQKLNIKTDTIF